MSLSAVFTSGTEQDVTSFPTVAINYQILGSTQLLGAPLTLTVPLFNPDANYSVISAYYRPQVAGSTTVTLVHAISSTPIGSSVNIMQSTFNLSGATDVTQTALLVVGSSITNLAVGDQLGLRPSTLGACSGQGLLTVILQRI